MPARLHDDGATDACFRLRQAALQTEDVEWNSLQRPICGELGKEVVEVEENRVSSKAVKALVGVVGHDGRGVGPRLGAKEEAERTIVGRTGVVLGCENHRRLFNLLGLGKSYT